MKYERYPGELYHFGIKGMKWGIRKKRASFGNKKQEKQKIDRKKLAKRIGIAVSLSAIVPTAILTKSYLKVNPDAISDAKELIKDYMFMTSDWAYDKVYNFKYR